MNHLNNINYLVFCSLLVFACGPQNPSFSAKKLSTPSNSSDPRNENRGGTPGKKTSPKDEKTEEEINKIPKNLTKKIFYNVIIKNKQDEEGGAKKQTDTFDGC